MYRSLEKHCNQFHLYIFSFNNSSFEILDKLKLESATIIHLDKFENEELLAIKSTRSKGEYCWTCTPSIIKFVLDNYKVNQCTYLDSDLLFFDDPGVLLEEMGKDSILLTEHRYTKKYDQSKKSGIYCVQFISFKNDLRGMKALNWWKDACIDWCFARFEDGKFGDQKYLDDWQTRFKGVHVLNNLGGGVAPWNVQQYKFFKKDGEIMGIEKKTNNKFFLIFFHFHNIKFLPEEKIYLSGYFLPTDAKEIMYKSYIKLILASISEINNYDKKFEIPISKLKLTYKILVRRLMGNKNIEPFSIKS